MLGPLEVEVDTGGPVDLGGPRQRAVLALLLAARGEVVPVGRMIEDLWRGDPPPRAIASLQAYVSHLRRLLEPARERRAPARVLVTAPPGYAIRVPTDAVDAGRFEAPLAEARAVSAAEPGHARRLLDAGLDLWRGPAYAEFAEEPWAQPEVLRLEELRLAARELLVDVRVRGGGAAEAVPEAEVLTRQAPLREESWRLLALALWRTGRQGDALAALRRARATLADQLGLDPGPSLVELESAILGQRVDLLAPVAATAARVAAPASEEVFVGRETELAALGRAATEAATNGPRVALVSGEAGAGKTTLLARFREELGSRGWLVTVGRCPEVEGAPPAWPWVEALRQLAEQVPPGELAPALAPLLGGGDGEAGGDVAAGRFRLHRAVGAWLGEAAAGRPVAVVLDDLHAADAETLLLLNSATEMTTGAVLFVAAMRPTDNRERLADTMAVLARRSPHRIQLGGLTTAQVERMLGALARTALDSDTVAALTERTGGNPFYVRESARLLAAEGTLVATSEVPEGVRDVLRRRLTRLPPSAVSVLRLAATLGREADLRTLVDASDTDEASTLEAVEVGLTAGLLTEPAPGRVRFVHGLVRDTVYTDLSHLRRTRLHARVADATRRLAPEDYPSLAHHYARAASADTAALAVDYAVRAAELAERRYAYDTAIEVLGHALDAAATVAGDRDALRVDLLGRLLRAQARAGAVAAARATRARAIDVAAASGRDDLLVAAFTAWTVPTPWLTHAYGVVDHRVVELLTRLLRTGDLDPVARCRLLDALATELDGEADPRGAASGREALALSRRLDDPELRALGLAARVRTMSYEREARHRRDLALELRDLADEHGLVTYRSVAEQVLGHCAAALNEPGELRASVARHGWLADTYQLNEAQVIHLCALGAIAHVAGDFVAARRHYDEVAVQMRRQGSLHAEAFHYFSVATLLISQGRFGEHVEATLRVRESLGPIVDDLLALALIDSGRVDEARAMPLGRHTYRPDYFESALLSVRGMVIVALGRRDLAQPVIDALLPVRDQLAGFATTAAVVRPVALTLGELFRLLGRTEEATRHFTLAAGVARRWESPHWLAAATAALAD
ncbi:BTAD domain-containing putative transcriptional regulator [Micromonospora sp. WMMD964]|uniref:ATP-binding protein n=1 Tax=Micromonospora sp. WMMD964 TaxID=3016091 RepID=UPI00249B2E3D|nr:BTAD domain-containing putative transcriptional regulator [Micromonospora sp. WMMD964]WFE99505.1 BTAD domain-containing putative transcriptional regulator [Micromonospora sp. WMMD964]